MTQAEFIHNTLLLTSRIAFFAFVLFAATLGGTLGLVAANYIASPVGGGDENVIHGTINILMILGYFTSGVLFVVGCVFARISYALYLKLKQLVETGVPK